MLQKSEFVHFHHFQGVCSLSQNPARACEFHAWYISQQRKEAPWNLILSQTPTKGCNQTNRRCIFRSHCGSGADPSGPIWLLCPFTPKSGRERDPENAAKFTDLSGWQLAGNGTVERGMETRRRGEQLAGAYRGRARHSATRRGTA